MKIQTQTLSPRGQKKKREISKMSRETGREGAPEQLVAASCSTATVSCTFSTATAASVLSQSPVEEPRLPLLRRYPATKVGQQDRYFNRRWYEDYKWMEYSISKDRAFCFAWRPFQPPGNQGGEKAAFTHDGYQNWKKATSSFKTHNASVEHKYAMTAWNEWTIQEESGLTICNALSDGHSKIVWENREYMRAVVESLCYSAYQGLSQRGDIENDMAVNQGNFLELLQVIGKFNKIVAQKISDNPRNAKYRHHDIQNEILGKPSTQQPCLPVHTHRKNQGPGCPEDYRLICTEPQHRPFVKQHLVSNWKAFYLLTESACPVVGTWINRADLDLDGTRRRMHIVGQSAYKYFCNINIIAKIVMIASSFYKCVHS